MLGGRSHGQSKMGWHSTHKNSPGTNAFRVNHEANLAFARNVLRSGLAFRHLYLGELRLLYLPQNALPVP